MSRFADPALTETILLGPCDCPGKPHDSEAVPGQADATGDYAVARTRLGASAIGRIGKAEIDGAVAGDHFAGYRRLILESVIAWNLQWLDPSWEEESGEEREVVGVPINDITVELMEEDTLRTLATSIDEAMGRASPNGSAVPSRVSRQVRRSRTRTQTPKRGT